MRLFCVASQAGQRRNVVGSETALHDVNISEEKRREEKERFDDGCVMVYSRRTTRV